MLGYNYGVKSGDISHYARQLHQLRLNTMFFVSKKRSAPYLNLDFLVGKYKSNGEITHGHGYSHRTELVITDFSFDFGIGISIRRRHGNYWNLGAGLHGFGKQLVNGTRRVANHQGDHFDSATGRTYPSFVINELEYKNDLRNTPPYQQRPYIKIEYGSHFGFTQNHNLEYKVGLSTWNLYFLIGLTKKPKP